MEDLRTPVGPRMVVDDLPAVAGHRVRGDLPAMGARRARGAHPAMAARRVADGREPDLRRMGAAALPVVVGPVVRGLVRAGAERVLALPVREVAGPGAAIGPARIMGLRGRTGRA